MQNYLPHAKALGNNYEECIMTVFLMVFRPINFAKGPTIDTIVGSSILLRTLHSEACRFAGEAQKRWQTFLMFYVHFGACIMDV